MTSSNRPHIAILGAGPTGLEAALAAAESGFGFTLYEAADEVAGHVRSWGHVKLFSPWSINISPRARRRLLEAGHELPPADSEECPTGDELVDRMLAPLAALPELAPNIETGTRVTEIGREWLLKHEKIGTGERAAHRFRLLVENNGRERVEIADVVLDCTGTYGNPNALGDGGIPAPGERALDDLIRRHIPNFFQEPDIWAGKTVLLVGSGHSAQTAVADLAHFAQSFPDTQVVWILRREVPVWRIVPDDPLPGRSILSQHAADLAGGASPAVEAIRGVVVESLSRAGGRIDVGLRDSHGEDRHVTVDWVLSLTGSVGDHTLYRQLQVHECYATSGPMKLAAALLGGESADCLEQESHGAEALVNPEPGFFILGAKSYGRNTTFLMRVGWEQVDEVFGLLGEEFAAVTTQRTA